MNATELVGPAARRRRKRSAEFKAQVIAACLKPGVSVAAAALANGLNASFLRAWAEAHRDQQRAAEPAKPGAGPRGELPENAPMPTLVPAAVQPAGVAPFDALAGVIPGMQTPEKSWAK